MPSRGWLRAAKRRAADDHVRPCRASCPWLRSVSLPSVLAGKTSMSNLPLVRLLIRTQPPTRCDTARSSRRHAPISTSAAQWPGWQPRRPRPQPRAGDSSIGRHGSSSCSYDCASRHALNSVSRSPSAATSGQKRTSTADEEARSSRLVGQRPGALSFAALARLGIIIDGPGLPRRLPTIERAKDLH